MVASIQKSQGRRRWAGGRDREGFRTYTLTTIVNTSDPLDGPQTVLNTPGLPAIGSSWNFGNDNDVWAFCYPDARITPLVDDGESSPEWVVEQTFGVRPNNRCQDTAVENPLLEPQKVSGSFVVYLQEAEEDKDGNMIKAISHERLRGPNVEFDADRATVRIEQNVAALGLETFTEMMNKVNDANLWGLGTRRVKLSRVSWARRYYGSCSIYYTRTFDFDVRFDTFDRRVISEGHKVLRGEWQAVEPPPGPGVPSYNWVNLRNPDKTKPGDFDQFKDVNGSNTTVIHNVNGNPIVNVGDEQIIDVKFYKEANFLTLGIPASL